MPSAPAPRGAASGAAPASQLATLPPVTAPGWDGGKFGHFTQAELNDMAARCELRWQLPPYGDTPALVGEDEAERLGLRPDQVSAYNQILARRSAGFTRQVAALASELGEGATAPSLAGQLDELRRQGGDEPGLAKRLADERATGRAREETTDMSPHERVLRIELAENDRFEAELVRELGPNLARALTAARGPKFTVTGCDAQTGLFRSQSLPR
jgi:hypothetical protein